MWKKSVLFLLCTLSMITFLCGCETQNRGNDAADTVQGNGNLLDEDNIVDSNANSGGEFDISFDGYDSILACYAHGCSSVSELIEEADAIVHCRVLAAVRENDLAIRYKLEVIEATSNIGACIELKQLKDEWMLKEGEEVVLAVVHEKTDAAYDIIGGGCGLFRMNGNVLSGGNLVNEVVSIINEKPSYISSSGSLLEKAYDVLAENHAK